MKILHREENYTDKFEACSSNGQFHKLIEFHWKWVYFTFGCIWASNLTYKGEDETNILFRLILIFMGVV